MQRRKFLATVGSLTAGTAAAMGTGAFSSVEAERSTYIEIAGDSNALLAFDSSNAANGEYVRETESGIEINISDENPTAAGGEGVNKNAFTMLRDLFDIKNLGTKPVLVFVSDYDSETKAAPYWAEYPAYSEPDAPAPQPGPTEPTTGLGGAPGSGGNTYHSPHVGEFQLAIPERLFLKPGDALREVGTAINTGNRETGDVFAREKWEVTAVTVDSVEEIVNWETWDKTVDIATDFS